MTNKYAHLDKLTAPEIALFKEKAKENQFQELEIKAGLLNFEKAKSFVVAEGDSWFDYFPGTDLIDCLRNHHNYYIKNYAKAGDTLENMIYGTGYDNSFTRTEPTINNVLRKIGELKPKVFLFSGGGNDIAGDEFASYLNHVESSLSFLRTNFIKDMIHNVFKNYYEDLIKKVTSASPFTHIITHGYAYTIPTGKGVGFSIVNFAGPWLKPALAMKGIFDLTQQKIAVDTLIDEFNNMLAELDKNYKNFHHIDLRKEIDAFSDWANELHLINSAYARVADLIDIKIKSIP